MTGTLLGLCVALQGESRKYSNNGFRTPNSMIIGYPLCSLSYNDYRLATLFTELLATDYWLAYPC